MDRRNHTYNQKWLAGCAIVLLIFVVGTAVFAVWSLERQRRMAHYPGAVPLSRHGNYSGLPFQLRWDDSYRSADPFVDVYRWYSLTFNLGAEARANDVCMEMEKTHHNLAVSQTVTVTICKTPRGQLIYVMRAFQLDWEKVRLPSSLFRLPSLSNTGT